jgi:hypothetical protein
VDARRYAVAADLHVDLAVRGGAVRLGLAPLVELWTVNAAGALRQTSTLLAEPGASLRAAYRLELGRVGLALGVDATTLFLADDLMIAGLGRVARTSSIRLGPYLAATVGL